MAYMLNCQVRYCWVPDGSAGQLGQSQADFPGYGAFTPPSRHVPAAQEASRSVSAAWVPAAADAPTDANFQTALNTCRGLSSTPTPSTAGSVPGFTAGKLTDLMRAWATGGP